MTDGILDSSKYGDIITNTKMDVNISNIVGQKLPGTVVSRAARDYYFVTDIVNPIFYFWSLKKKIQTPTAIQAKLDYGTYIHFISRSWFEKIPGFRFAEANVAGGYVGVDGVSGKIDYQTNDSIVELKTKEREVSGVDDIVNNFPQDLEQIVTYAGISSSDSREHFLVFASGKGSSYLSFRSFKIDINDLNGVRDFVRKRIKYLSDAIKHDDPMLLPRCRYYQEGCKFQLAGICNCANMKHETGIDLLKLVSVTEDAKIASILDSTSKSTTGKLGTTKPLSLWDVILPARKYYKHFEYRIDDDYIPDVNYEKNAKVSTIMSAVTRSDLAVTDAELNSLRNTHTLGFENRYFFIKISVPSISKEKIPVPYFVKVTASNRIYSERELPPIYYAQGALAAVDSDSKCAVIIVDFDNLENELAAYIIFPDKSKTHKAATSVLDSLTQSVKSGDPSTLPKCPHYMRNSCEYGSCLCKT
jgi:hypothetical protein